MKNLKLLLKSLVNNNTCIDGARKKPWYFAVLILFFSLILALIPSTVQASNNKGISAFSSTTYGTQEAATEFIQSLQIDDHSLVVAYDATTDSKYLKGESFEYDHYNASLDRNDFAFVFENSFSTATYSSLTEKKVSYYYFTQSELYINILNPNSTDTAVSTMTCRNAYSKFEEGYKLSSLYVENTDATTASNEMWENWKEFQVKAYNSTRLTGIWQNAVIMGAIDLVILLIMGFMVWVLCRGKNNPYRMFNYWECQKIAIWSGLCPGILTVAFGFLFASFANMLFPLTVGVRVMWLTMKSLRPDGTGYAAN